MSDIYSYQILALYIQFGIRFRNSSYLFGGSVHMFAWVYFHHAYTWYRYAKVPPFTLRNILLLISTKRISLRDYLFICTNFSSLTHANFSPPVNHICSTQKSCLVSDISLLISHRFARDNKEISVNMLVKNYAPNRSKTCYSCQRLRF